MKKDTKHVGKRKIWAEERKNKKEDNDVKKLHDVRELESEEKDREEGKRWVGMREHMRAPTLPTCRGVRNTRPEREKRQTSTEKLTATNLPPCSLRGSLTS